MKIFGWQFYIPGGVYADIWLSDLTTGGYADIWLAIFTTRGEDMRLFGWSSVPWGRVWLLSVPWRCVFIGVSVVVDVAAPVLCSPLGVGVLSGQAASCLMFDRFGSPRARQWAQGAGIMNLYTSALTIPTVDDRNYAPPGGPTGPPGPPWTPGLRPGGRDGTG